MSDLATSAATDGNRIPIAGGSTLIGHCLPLALEWQEV
jgi:hypothetical protein